MSRKKTFGLKSKNVRGMIKTLKTSLYKDHMIYIRSIYGIMFEYLLTHNNEIYSSFIVINPRKGQTKLSEQETLEAANLIITGAMTTVDFLTGVQLSDGDKKMAEEFIESGRKMEPVVAELPKEAVKE
jgi:hypothetical protein